MFSGDLDFNLQLLNEEPNNIGDDMLSEHDLLKLKQYISYLNDSGKKEMLNRIEELTQIKKYTEAEEREPTNENKEIKLD